jgi:hypothetical protein
MPWFSPRLTRLLPKGSLYELRPQHPRESISFSLSDMSTAFPTPTPFPMTSLCTEPTRSRIPLSVTTQQLDRPQIASAGYPDKTRKETKRLHLSKQHHLQAQRRGMWEAVDGKLHPAEGSLKSLRSSGGASGGDSGTIDPGLSSQDRGSSSKAQPQRLKTQGPGRRQTREIQSPGASPHGF